MKFFFVALALIVSVFCYSEDNLFYQPKPISFYIFDENNKEIIVFNNPGGIPGVLDFSKEFPILEKIIFVPYFNFSEWQGIENDLGLTLNPNLKIIEYDGYGNPHADYGSLQRSGEFTVKDFIKFLQIQNFSSDQLIFNSEFYDIDKDNIEMIIFQDPGAIPGVLDFSKKFPDLQKITFAPSENFNLWQGIENDLGLNLNPNLKIIEYESLGTWDPEYPITGVIQLLYHSNLPNLEKLIFHLNLLKFMGPLPESFFFNFTGLTTVDLTLNNISFPDVNYFRNKLFEIIKELGLLPNIKNIDIKLNLHGDFYLSQDEKETLILANDLISANKIEPEINITINLIYEGDHNTILSRAEREAEVKKQREKLKEQLQGTNIHFILKSFYAVNDAPWVNDSAPW